VYRPAWTHDEAIALLRRDSGTAFDARCVAALEQVLTGEAPVGQQAASLTTLRVSPS
jgi:HD-GYP domain-containing protein (c-di-GMP phosphodiesterase class II)